MMYNRCFTVNSINIPNPTRGLNALGLKMERSGMSYIKTLHLFVPLV